MQLLSRSIFLCISLSVLSIFCQQPYQLDPPFLFSPIFLLHILFIKKKKKKIT
ncbi:hypothetical protein JHK87_025413 [Glycine soja]|nr:hypothetical protein JHK87_025413 [Glycine soja]